jgi:SAM-dependent methyltransferase
MVEQSMNPEFDQYAEEYDAALNKGLKVSGESKEYFARGRMKHLGRVLRKVGVTPYYVMDFGCGTGTATPFILEQFEHVRGLVGTDVSEKSLSVARRQFGSDKVEFKLMEEYRPGGRLDLVVCNGVFHHIPVAERAGCVKYIWESLRPGGVFAMFENNPWNPGTRLIMSRIPFDKDAVTLSPIEGARMIGEGGFEMVRRDYLFVFPGVMKWLRPVERVMVKAPVGAQYLVMGRKRK